MPITVKPTQADLAIAQAVARHTDERTEKAADLLTWGADEHLLEALAMGWWLWSRGVQPVEGEPATTCLSRPLPLRRCRICSKWCSTKSGPIA